MVKSKYVEKHSGFIETKKIPLMIIILPNEVDGRDDGKGGRDDGRRYFSTYFPSFSLLISLFLLTFLLLIFFFFFFLNFRRMK